MYHNRALLPLALANPRGGFLRLRLLSETLQCLLLELRRLLVSREEELTRFLDTRRMDRTHHILLAFLRATPTRKWELCVCV